MVVGLVCRVEHVLPDGGMFTNYHSDSFIFTIISLALSIYMIPQEAGT